MPVFGDAQRLIGECIDGVISPATVIGGRWILRIVSTSRRIAGNGTIWRRGLAAPETSMKVLLLAPLRSTERKMLPSTGLDDGGYGSISSLFLVYIVCMYLLHSVFFLYFGL